MLSGFLLDKKDTDLLANVHLDPSNADSCRPRQETGHGKRLCGVPPDQRHEPSAEFCS